MACKSTCHQWGGGMRPSVLLQLWVKMLCTAMSAAWPGLWSELCFVGLSEATFMTSIAAPSAEKHTWYLYAFQSEGPLISKFCGEEVVRTGMWLMIRNVHTHTHTRARACVCARMHTHIHTHPPLCLRHNTSLFLSSLIYYSLWPKVSNSERCNTTASVLAVQIPLRNCLPRFCWQRFLDQQKGRGSLFLLLLQTWKLQTTLDVRVTNNEVVR